MLQVCLSTLKDYLLHVSTLLRYILATVHNSLHVPYSWKFSRDKNFEDFDLSSKIKTSKYGFKIIFIGERPCTSKIYSRKVGKR